MKESLVNYLVKPLLVLLPFLPNNINAQSQEFNSPTPIEISVNMYSRPNLHYTALGKKLLEYYGSGDANNDEVLNSQDSEAIRNGVSNDMADVNGDGFVNSQDADLIDNYLQGNIPYIPGSNWEKSSPQEKRNWLEKMIKIDKTDEILRNEYGWDCDNYAYQTMINFFGVSNLEQAIQQGRTPGGCFQFSEYNGRFNLPVYFTSTTFIQDAGSHSINSCLIDDNSLSFSQEYFFDNETDKNINPGDPAMDPNSPVTIKWKGYKKETGTFSGIELVRFNLQGGEASSITYFEPMIPRTNPNKTVLNINQLEKKILDYYSEINVEDHISEMGEPGVSTNVQLGENFEYSFGNYSYKGENFIESKPDSFSTPFYPNPENTTNYIVQRRIIKNLVQRTLYTDAIKNNEINDFTLKSDTTYQEIEVGTPTGVEDESNLHQDYMLYQNYPNPFNPETTIRYSIPQPSQVTLTLYDITGREIDLYLNKYQTAGEYEFTINCGNLPSGVYLYCLSAGGYTATRKMVLLR